ncbi:methyl-accepting chemotaxis protein [Ferrimonas balearica]|uniref:methyl-accepting chemotaxis protein n=1 Tax=Ferrimonas balearica TaxID=44012 RepID=UPI001C99DF39|nr:methyl-accepting chemotaxis protein [Ferrimonas balearica]MBY5923013.1 methyl-accepting chemotaxis protein [Ferrimonas balearica]MBY5997610.1 methyl-accepting chemotaxis protein [Ferrimonas balearica]
MRIKISIKLKLMILVLGVNALFAVYNIGQVLSLKSAVLKEQHTQLEQEVTVLLKEQVIGQVDNITLAISDDYHRSQEAAIQSDLVQFMAAIRGTVTRLYDNTLSDDPSELIYTFLNEYRTETGRYLFAYNATTYANEAVGNGTTAMGNDKMTQDEHGNYYVQEIVDGARQQEIAFTRYYFTNPESGKVEEKVSASFLFEPLDLVIASGEYLSSLQAGLISEALETVARARYGGSGYFWIQDEQGTILAHPNRALIGQVVPATEKIAAELRGQEEAFVGTTFNNPKTGQVEDKISYARRIMPDWGWTIGTGIYQSDIDQVTRGLDADTKAIFDDKAMLSMWVTIALTLAIISVSLFLISILAKALNQLRERIENLSSGEADLTARLEVTSNDEIGQIQTAINRFVGELQSMLLDIQTANMELEAGFAGLRRENEQSMVALEHHADRTANVVTATGQMDVCASDVASRSAKTSEHTRKGNDQARHAMAAMTDSSESVSALVAQLDEAKSWVAKTATSSEQISQVLTVIGGIAEQTNLLALNAAIEAARAGEQGRGFAVVADEVRALATRTQECTTEIGALLESVGHDVSSTEQAINSTVQRCDVVVEKTGRVSADLEQLTDSIGDIDKLTAQIATAAEEQSTVSRDIADAIGEIEGTAQGLKGGAQHTTEALLGLTATHKHLNELVARFKLESSTAPNGRSETV